MLKGGAIYYVLLLILITTILSGFILLIGYMDFKTLATDSTKLSLRMRVDSTLFSRLHSDVPAEFSQQTNTNSIEKIESISSQWGALNLFCVRGETTGYSYSKFCLTGFHINRYNDIALYMPEGSRGVSLSGSSRLIGDCHLPDGSIQAGSIEGKPFTGENLVEGEIIKSKGGLPEVAGRFLKMDQYLLKILDEEISSKEVYGYITDTINNSFGEPTQLLYCQGPIIVSSGKLSGKIIIQSSQSIFVSSSVSLEDVLLFAPVITFEENFSGSCQCFGEQTIEVGDNCNFKFPSLLCISGKNEDSGHESRIIIGHGSQVNGGIFCSNGINNSITINSEACVYGQTYCNGRITLVGNIAGSLFCRAFYYETRRAKYVNHLLNCTIDFTNLSKYYSGFGFFEDDTNQVITKWLD